MAIRWPEVYPPATYRLIALPTYAFDRQSYWAARPTALVASEAVPETVQPVASPPAIAYGRPDLDTSFVAPRTDTERQLVELWKVLFGLERVGVCDSFFDLGGDSLLSVRLFSDIEKTFHCKLSLADLSGDLTVETLATYLMQQGAVRTTSVTSSRPSRSAPHGMSAIDFHTLLSLSTGRQKRRVGDRGLLCELQAGDRDRPPLIAIGAKLGKWADDFGKQQTVYCLPSTWMLIRNPKTYIQSLAAVYADEIQSAQPEGPYFLLGYCFEGWVAFEVAHQLRARGQDIGMLAILDRDAPYADPFYLKRSKSLLKYALARSRQGWDEWRAKLGLDNTSAQVYRQRMTPRIVTALGQAIRSYQPRPYPGDVTLFLSTTYADRYERNPQEGWGALVTGKLDVHRVEAEHLDVIQSPH
ncbi:MAG: thioesterase domain-containing protein, partial [Cyanobacteria bacterium J06648_11]